MGRRSSSAAAAAAAKLTTSTTSTTSTSRSSRWVALLMMVGMLTLNMCGGGVHGATTNTTTPAAAGNSTAAGTNSTANSTANSTSVYPPCQGVQLVYELTAQPVKIYPFITDSTKQAYSFGATINLTNQGYNDLSSDWTVGIDYRYNEIIVSGGGLVLEDGSAAPWNVSQGAILAPSSTSSSLKTAIETAGDMSQISRQYVITGTEFGQKLSPMPRNINLTSTGYNCSVASSYGLNNTLRTCCVESNNNISLTSADSFLPSEKGNITITYDVTNAYSSNYQAKVTISNDSPIARIDNWNLSWTWQEGEFIWNVKGAQAQTSDISACLNGAASTDYTSLDVNSAASCSPNPVILDLPVDKTNDTTLGNVKYCCKNGTIMPAIIDPSKSKAAFTMQVYKLSPQNQNTSTITAPASFKFGDGTYKCGPTRLIEPSVFPNTDTELVGTTSAVKTWQITCNVTTVTRTPKCCVTFSTYSNESISPCKTCACGCPANPTPTCNKNATALALPYSALTLAPENRTSKVVAWAGIKHTVVPNPLPCQDYCGVSINWHIVSDYTKGWSARMTIFDWSTMTYVDWFTVIELDKAFLGFQKAYSFNATALTAAEMNNTFLNNSIVVQGLQGGNYLMAEQNFDAGKLQSVFSFTKTMTPGISISNGDGFPTKVWFDGEECSLPEGLPTAGAFRIIASHKLTIVVVIVVVILGPFGVL